MDALDRVLVGRAARVVAFEVRAKFMGLYDGWFHDVFRELCGSGGLLELSVVNTKYGECYPLPSPVYSCATLTTLDLCNWRLRVPERIAGLRAVRSLRLRDVVATDADLRRLISRCGALEHLEIHDLHKARNVVVRAPCLENAPSSLLVVLLVPPALHLGEECAAAGHGEAEPLLQLP
jgi:hypothetical protein